MLKMGQRLQHVLIHGIVILLIFFVSSWGPAVIHEPNIWLTFTARPDANLQMQKKKKKKTLLYKIKVKHTAIM